MRTRARVYYEPRLTEAERPLVQACPRGCGERPLGGDPARREQRTQSIAYLCQYVATTDAYYPQALRFHARRKLDQ